MSDYITVEHALSLSPTITRLSLLPSMAKAWGPCVRFEGIASDLVIHHHSLELWFAAAEMRLSVALTLLGYQDIPLSVSGRRPFRAMLKRIAADGKSLAELHHAFIHHTIAMEALDPTDDVPF